MARVDFSQSEQASETINQWIGEQTENKITELISADALSPQMRLVFPNAVYFQGSWAEPFQQQRTRQESFHLGQAESIEVSP